MTQQCRNDPPSIRRTLRRWLESPAIFAAPFLAGVGAGIVLRYLFSDEHGGPLSAMSGAFVIGAPLIVGAVTVFIAEQIDHRSWGFYARAGACSVVLFVLGTMMLALEGLICVALISPLFAAMGSIGGLIMGAACRLGRHVRQTMQAIALLPFLILLGESITPLPTQVHVVRRSISITAAPEEIWPHLLEVKDIDADQFLHAWAFRIGVPVPVSAVISESNIPVRRVHMAKQVYFDQVAVDVVANDRVRWQYRFYRDSFPPGAMDDHVRIGGRYFDLLDTEYALHPEGNTTRLEVTVRYRLSTRFNWYAGPVVDQLMKNAADAYLNLYRTLSEGAET